MHWERGCAGTGTDYGNYGKNYEKYYTKNCSKLRRKLHGAPLDLCNQTGCAGTQPHHFGDATLRAVQWGPTSFIYFSRVDDGGRPLFASWSCSWLFVCPVCPLVTKKHNNEGEMTVTTYAMQGIAWEFFLTSPPFPLPRTLCQDGVLCPSSEIGSQREHELLALFVFKRNSPKIC